MISIAQAVLSLQPDASFTVVDGAITWLSPNLQQPTKKEIDAEIARLSSEQPFLRVRIARHAAYAAPDGPDAIFLQYQRGDATEQEWLDAVQAVKDAHPYPEG
jgi:hypothetical protein